MSVRPQSQPLPILSIQEMASRRPDTRFIPRNPTPVENHRPTLSYSNVTRQGIPNQGHASHEGAIVGQKATAVPVINQTNMASQVSNVNPTGAQLSGAPVANTGSNQMQMIPNNVMQTSGPRFGHQTPFHQHQAHAPRQAQPRQNLLQNRHPTHAGSVPNSGVQQPVAQQHVQFYMPPNLQAQHLPQYQQNPNYITHNMAAHQYSQGRTMNMYQTYVPAFTPQQTAFSQQSAYQTAYGAMYGTPAHPYQTHPQAAAPMIPPPMHQSRGTPVSNPPVIQAQQQPMVSLQTNNSELNETTQMATKQMPQRTRRVAILTDPNTGKDVDIEQLAKEEPKSQVSTNRPNESYTGASTQANSLSTSTPKSSTSNDSVNIGIEFATKVAVAATEPVAAVAKRTPSPNATESENSLNTNLISKPETEEPVANIKTTSSELSETNDKMSDICDKSTDDESLVINNINSSNNVSNSSSATKTDLKQLKSSTQNPVKSVIQVTVESASVQEINENGDIDDLCSDSFQNKEETPEIAKDQSIQKNNINNNNNNRKKEMIIKEDKTRSEEVVEAKVDTSSVTDIPKTIVSESCEPQHRSDRSSPVMTRSESVDKSSKTDVSNNSDNCDESDEQINRINDLKSKEADHEEEEPDQESVSGEPSLPDLPYQDDQWTPLNPDGKKHYDRDFLLAVRQKSESLLKMPESLMNDKRSQEIIRKESSSPGQYQDDPGSLFMPNFASKHGSDFRRGVMPHGINRRQSQPGRHQEKQRKIISTSLTQDVKLRTTENAWKPTKLVATTNDPDEQETQELLKKIRGILNKLTPQKYDDLVGQIMSFKIDTEDRLKRVLDLVFEKAVDEPAFCLQYANLCKHLSQFKVTINKDDKVEEVKFHKLLISKCQKEFEADIYASITDMKERQEEIDRCSDLQKKKMLKEILDEDMRRARKRSLGNIKLIGELYKLNMLKANIMVQCIDGLLRDADDESLECLCALFRTIGEQIETEAKNHQKSNYTQVLDSFFNKMETIAEQKNPEVKGTSARVRFMLRDIIDMRRNNWKARRDENLPKTIEEIHQDMQKEEEKSARDLHQHTLNKKQEERERKQKGGRQGNDEVWTTVTARKSQNAPNPNIDWGMMRSQQQVNHENVQLGPQPGNWSMGSRGGAQSSSQSKFSSKEDNRFAALDGNDRKSSQKSNSRDSSKGRSNQSHGFQSSRGGNRPQRGGEREDAINLARSFSSHRQSPNESSLIYSNMSRNSSRGGSREASAPNSRNSSMRRETPELESSRLKGSNISEEEFQRKTDNCLKEYLNVLDLKEVAMEVTTLCNESNVTDFVSQAINLAVETTSQKIRFDIGRLFDYLLSSNTIKFDHFYKGLNAVLEMEEDIIIDIPKFWEYIGEVLAPIFINLTQNRKQFLNEVSKCKADKRPEVVAKDTTKAHELFVSSDLRWNELLGPDVDVEQFVTNHSVQFTTKLSNKSSNSDHFKQFISEVERMVKQKRNGNFETMNDEIQSYINKNFNNEQTTDPRFTSALFSAIIRGCIIEPSEEEQYSYTLDKPLLIHACPLLSKFLGGDAERELQALIALQELMGNLEHPSGLLYNLFQILYDNSAISHDAFLQWEAWEPNAQAKAAAVLSVVRFLTWLRENEESDEDNELNDANS